MQQATRPLPSPVLMSSTTIRIASLSAMIATATIAGCASLAGATATGANPALQGPGITLFAAGDIADCRRVVAADSGAAHTAAVIKAGIASDSAAVVLALGDTTYPVGLPAEFSDCYEPTWGSFKARTLPAPGNHEYYTTGAPGYFGYFGASAGSRERSYYSTTIGNWHLVAIDSNLRPPASDVQLAWLKTDLAQLRHRDTTRGQHSCILAYWHHPVYSSGGHGNNAHMRSTWNALLAARADVVLSAHDHDYERFAPQGSDANLDTQNGIRAFVVGTGGATLSLFGATKPNSLAQDNSSHGVLKMLLKPGGYGWAFLPTDGGLPRDAGSADCHD